jgi:uncharacterized protein (TIGR02466 family)
MPHITLLFPKLLYSEDLNISDVYNNEIKQEIVKILADEDNSVPTSVTNYFSSKNITEDILKNPVFAPLFAMIRENIRSFCKEVKFNRELQIQDVWLSITHPGKYHNIHKHPNVTLAGVYYVESEPSTNLEFICDNKFGVEDHTEKLNSKKLLLFDGSLVHGFTHVSMKEPKITIAFNCNPC